MGSLDETQAQLNYEMAIYREQISMLKRETERVSLTTVDLTNALKTVEELDATKVLIPIGGGAMVKGQVSETKVLMPIGAGYLVDMEKTTATVELNKRIDATKKAVERLSDEFNKISSKLRDISMQIQQTEQQARIMDRGDETMKEDYL
ncbi:prefoldin subunit alpha [Candidatus Micrarchaeota archaeon]|nr:prefoldin subunit alpha [Candidatus Micrarchaeota archaeon]